MKRIEDTVTVKRTEKEITISTEKATITTPTNLMDNHFQATADEIMNSINRPSPWQEMLKRVATWRKRKKAED